MKSVELETDYQVSSGDVKLTVVFGDRQIGGSAVRIGPREKGRGQITKLRVGKGSTIKGRKLVVKSVVADVNDKTNHTSVSYTLEGGPLEQTFVSKAVVDNDGDSITYRAVFKFKG